MHTLFESIFNFRTENRIKLIQILLISLDLVLETLSAGLLIAANAVCGGTKTDDSNLSFNYGKYSF